MESGKNTDIIHLLLIDICYFSQKSEFFNLAMISNHMKNELKRNAVNLSVLKFDEMYIKTKYTNVQRKKKIITIRKFYEKHC